MKRFTDIKAQLEDRFSQLIYKNLLNNENLVKAPIGVRLYRGTPIDISLQLVLH